MQDVIVSTAIHAENGSGRFGRPGREFFRQPQPTASSTSVGSVMAARQYSGS